jgi:fumarylacetoacetase
MTLNHTHDPRARSWVTTAQLPGCDFTLQNLPFAVFRRSGIQEAWRGGVAIGDQVIDLAALAQGTALQGPARQAATACAMDSLNAFMAMGPAAWRALRHALFDLLRDGASGPPVEALRACLLPQADVVHRLPAHIGDYTDFYTSIHHARNVAQLIRPDAALSPNFQWLPIAYHGRASSVVVSGTPCQRPLGQALPPGAQAPRYGACQWLDHELEMGAYIGPGNPLGQPITLADAEQHIFGLCLLNDWSARDHQFWEMNPLGPFLGKNFCTSVSPWVVSLEALTPFRTPFERPAEDPQPLPYLEGEANRRAGGLDVRLEAWIETREHRRRGIGADQLSATRFSNQYWTLAQMVAQHTVGGCNLQPGDLLGTGTVSGPTPAEAGALVELSLGGTQALTLPGTGEQRTFLEDGDTVILRGWCEKDGAARVGFGECRGEVLPAL